MEGEVGADRERQSMNMEKRVLQADLKAEGKTLRGYAAVFNSRSEDLGGFVETILPGAFTRSLEAGSDVRALIGHDMNQVIGRRSAGTLRLAEDERGLAIEIDLPDTQAARDLAVLVERGDINQMSFGFTLPPGGDKWDPPEDGDKLRRRTLKDIEVHEVSVVALPAYADTSVALRSMSQWENRKKSDETRKRINNLLVRIGKK
jgi:HK97 family phage prohead protease